ncbi:MAG: hypothetical protein QE265_07020 [Rhodoferax sp.]|nr:hypothetical protein [Rhodoferax sp.]
MAIFPDQLADASHIALIGNAASPNTTARLDIHTSQSLAEHRAIMAALRA